MAAPNLFIFFYITLSLLTYASSQTLHEQQEQSDDSSLQIKHQHLLSKILNLESSIDERSREINFKDERIKQLEMIVLEKSNSLTALHSEVQSLQKKESVYAKEVEGEAHARASELAKQVDNLKAEILKQNTKKEALEARINVAEKSIAELNVKLEKEERIRLRLNAARYSKELEEVHDSWLPSWFAVPLFHYQSVLVTHWNVYGRPALDITVQKALETQAKVRKWARPHIDDLHTEAKKFTKPYINQLSKTLGPHINKTRIFLKPYTKKILRGYRRFSKTTVKYHRQVHANIHQVLKENEFTRPFASYELAWLLASAVMAIPLMVLFSWLSALFSKKPKRRTRSSHTSHSRRRAKRVHPDKASASR